MQARYTQQFTNRTGLGYNPYMLQDKPSIYWPLVITALIIYGSCIPFQIDLSAYQPSNAWGLFSISLRRFDLNDLVTNIAVYIPFGFLWMRRWFAQHRLNLSDVFIVGFAGVVLSVMVESLQAGMALRYASWCDVVFNGFGSMAGAALWLTLQILYYNNRQSIRKQWATQPFNVAVFVMTLGIFCYELIPFDFLTSSTALHSAFHRAQWLPLITGNLLAPTSLTAGLAERLTGAAWFALLGYLLAMSHRKNKRAPFTATGYAIFHGIILVSVIEGMQLFTRSHVFELEAILFRSLAVVCGAWVAVNMVNVGDDDGKRKIFDSTSHRTKTVYFFVALAVFQMLILIASAAPMNQWSTLSLSRGTFHWIPFETLWHESFHFAVANMLAVVMTYATLSVTLLMIIPRFNRDPSVWIIGAFIFSVAFFVEIAQWLTGCGTPDITTPLIALASSIAASRAYFTLQSLQATAPNK